jgi:osomolarity two-component system, sensor histidine kinase NIK1
VDIRLDWASEAHNPQPGPVKEILRTTSLRCDARPGEGRAKTAKLACSAEHTARPPLSLSQINMPNEETSAAVASVLSNLAKSYAPLDEHSFPAHVIANGAKTTKITLPGEDSVEKRTLERELTALSSRIQLLEAKASTGTASLPITPNEPLASAFSDTPASPKPPERARSHRQRSASWVNSLLSKSNGEQQTRQLTEEQFAWLREHIDQQAQEIKSQKDFIDGIKSQLTHQQTATKAALDTLGNSTSIEQLKREIEKNAQINATYQKVLREIGTIITAVANGDLSKKVLIHVTEKDPEIARFKHTINRMVDQLQEFASQVTHLARDVGTEGRLGGQAVVPGVDGIWAELTQNGMLREVCRSRTGLMSSQSMSWHRI